MQIVGEWIMRHDVGVYMYTHRHTVCEMHNLFDSFQNLIAMMYEIICSINYQTHFTSPLRVVSQQHAGINESNLITSHISVNNLEF